MYEASATRYGVAEQPAISRAGEYYEEGMIPEPDAGDMPGNGGSSAPRLNPASKVPAGRYEQAGFGLRYGAWMFDFLITLIVMMGSTFLITALSKRSVVGSNKDLLTIAGITILLVLFNFALLAGLIGQSAGMRILGIRIIRIDGKPFGIRNALLRHFVGYPISTAIFFMGFLWMLWDSRQQGWHDKIAKTVVVMTR